MLAHNSLLLQFGVVHISAGDLLRAEVELGTPEGKQAQSFMDRGNLVPNEIVVSMVKNRLSKQACSCNVFAVLQPAAAATYSLQGLLSSGP